MNIWLKNNWTTQRILIVLLDSSSYLVPDTFCVCTWECLNKDTIPHQLPTNQYCELCHKRPYWKDHRRTLSRKKCFQVMKSYVLVLHRGHREAAKWLGVGKTYSAQTLRCQPQSVSGVCPNVVAWRQQKHFS